MSRFLVSAAHKSSGKTTISIGLAASLAARGLSVQTFKKGPDYIDPMWLGKATGRPCRNLDFFLSSPDELHSEFARQGADADVCLVEGNKGLYDGLALDGANSNAALAKLLGLPVVLVLDARGMTRGIAPLILGYQAFDRDVRIAGVILNRLGGSRHESKLRAVIEHYTDVPVIGAVADDASMGILERHLGLVPANEAEAALEHVSRIGAGIARQVDLDRLLQVSAGEPLAVPDGVPMGPAAQGSPVRLGVAQDSAFGFYYPGDLEALKGAGAQLVPVHTLRDPRLPEIDGLFIGGGFPESFAGELEANAALRADIRRAIEGGLPVYAECGGLMYLARSLSWRGQTHHMVGAIPGDVVMHDKPVGRGYVRLRPTATHPWASAGTSREEIRGHEFHYSSVENLPPNTRFAYRVARGHGVDGQNDGIVHRNVLASYSHLRTTGTCDWATRFVAFVRRHGRTEPCRESEELAFPA